MLFQLLKIGFSSSEIQHILKYFFKEFIDEIMICTIEILLFNNNVEFEITLTQVSISFLTEIDRIRAIYIKCCISNFFLLISTAHICKPISLWSAWNLRIFLQDVFAHRRFVTLARKQMNFLVTI